MKKIFLLFTCSLLFICNVCFANDITTKEYTNSPGVAYLVIGDMVHVRTHPSTDGYIICTLPKGSWVKAFDYNSKGIRDNTGMYWKYIIMEDGHVGWIAHPYISLRC